MTEKLHRRKIIVLFLGISLFAFFVAKKTKYSNIPDISATDYSIEERVEQNAQEVEVVQDVFYEIDENLEPVKQVYPDVVLSAQDGGECRTADLVYSSERICAAPDLSLSEDWSGSGSSTQIDSSRSIWLTNITVPPLLSGSPVMDNEVRQIYKDLEGKYHWTLKPAGEMTSYHVTFDRAYPGDERTKMYVDEAHSAQNLPFAVEYRIQVEGDAEGGGESEYTIDEYYENDCGSRCRNNPNPTPEKANQLSKIGTLSQQPPGYNGETSSESTEETIEDCEEDAVLLPMETNANTASYACTPTIKQVFLSFTSWLENIFNPDACSDNDEENDQNCVSVADIVIIMESPWGTRKDCYEEGLCVNEYNEVKNSYTKIPDDGGESDVYVLTDCQAVIEGLATVQTLKCAWDVDYISEELQFQSADNIPQEEYPDRMEYMEFHINESENRTDSPLTM